MKARNRKTGEIVDISDFSKQTLDKYNVVLEDLDILLSDNGSEPINWEQRRYEIAKAAMQGILSNEDEVEYACSEAIYGERKHTIPIAISQLALACADALIKELKGEELND